MSKVTNATDPSDLKIIVDIIHDCWFNKDDIVFDSSNHSLCIPFQRTAMEKERTIKKFLFFKKIRIPVIECFLGFHHVRDYSVEDKVQVGNYDFNTIKYEPETKTIQLTTGVPIGIEIVVEDFEITVEETENIIEERTCITI